NEKEALVPLLKRLGIKEDGRKEYTLSMIGKNQLKLIVATSGEEGCNVFMKNYFVHVPAHKFENIVDTSGAGDAFIAQFINQLNKTNLNEVLIAKDNIVVIITKASKQL